MCTFCVLSGHVLADSDGTDNVKHIYVYTIHHVSFYVFRSYTTRYRMDRCCQACHRKTHAEVRLFGLGVRIECGGHCCVFRLLCFYFSPEVSLDITPFLAFVICVCMHMCVLLCACTWVCVCLHMYVCTLVCMHMSVCVSAHVCVYMHTNVCVCECMCV